MRINNLFVIVTKSKVILVTLPKCNIQLLQTSGLSLMIQSRNVQLPILRKLYCILIFLHASGSIFSQCAVFLLCTSTDAPSAPPHRALRIHFVGFALLCTLTLQVHSYISDFYERLKKKDSPSVCRKRPSKVQSPEFQEDLKVCLCHWNARIEVARSEARQPRVGVC